MRLTEKGRERANVAQSYALNCGAVFATIASTTPPYKGASIYDVRTLGGGGCGKADKGNRGCVNVTVTGGKKIREFADVIFGRPQHRHRRLICRKYCFDRELFSSFNILKQQLAKIIITILGD